MDMELVSREGLLTNWYIATASERGGSSGKVRFSFLGNNTSISLLKLLKYIPIRT
jgi:hypothetical protein